MSLPVNVYCDFPEGRELIAQVANVRDVKLFFKPYHNLITWNADDLAKEGIDIDGEHQQELDDND